MSTTYKPADKLRAEARRLGLRDDATVEEIGAALRDEAAHLSDADTVTIDGSDYPVGHDSMRLAARTEAILAADGKKDSYTAEEYLAAARQAEREIGVSHEVQR